MNGYLLSGSDCKTESTLCTIINELCKISVRPSFELGHPEAVAQRCSVKKEFSEISRN